MNTESPLLPLSLYCGMVDFFIFYTTEINLFNRLVSSMRKEPSMAKTVIATWLWLEEMGHRELIRVMFSAIDSLVEAIFDETIRCLAYIAPNATPPTVSSDAPTLATLLNMPMNSRFFYYNRFFAQHGIQRIVDGVGSMIFGDTMSNDNFLHVNASSGMASAPLADGSSSTAELPRPTTMVMNNNAEASTAPTAGPLLPFTSTAMENRVLFLVFPSGSPPFTQKEIFNFFTLKWGDLFEEVNIESTPRKVPPQFGRVVVKFASAIQAILNGQQMGRFVVRGRSLWAGVYVPRAC